jgi:hypothetical protein
MCGDFRFGKSRLSECGGAVELSGEGGILSSPTQQVGSRLA